MSPPPAADRENVLAGLANTIDLVVDQIESFEITTHDDQELLLKWIRTHGYLIGQYRKLLKDEDLDDMQESVEFLETITEVRGEGD